MRFKNPDRNIRKIFLCVSIHTEKLTLFCRSFQNSQKNYIHAQKNYIKKDLRQYTQTRPPIPIPNAPPETTPALPSLLGLAAATPSSLPPSRRPPPPPSVRPPPPPPLQLLPSLSSEDGGGCPCKAGWRRLRPQICLLPHQGASPPTAPRSASPSSLPPSWRPPPPPPVRPPPPPPLRA